MRKPEVTLAALLTLFSQAAWGEPSGPPAPTPGPAPRAAAGEAPRVRSNGLPLVTSSLARQAIQVAFTRAGFPAARLRSDAMVTRIGLSALLPDLSLRVARSTDQSLRFSPTYDDPYRYSEAGGVGWWIDGRATWHLDRLLFDANELAVERIRAGRAEAAGKLAHRVLQLLFEWQRARRAETNELTTEEDRASAALRALEAQVTLDVLTGGWFTTRVESALE